jgi:transposase
VNHSTKPKKPQVLFWLIWGVACLVFLAYPGTGNQQAQPILERPALEGVVTPAGGEGSIFWQPRRRLRQWAWRRYCQLYQAHQRAVWVARLAQLALWGALTIAQVVEVLTQSQLVLKLGSLPVLYGLLEKLEVRRIINQIHPTRSKVDHGAVITVLVLNRLVLPLPMYKVSEWVSQTILEKMLGLPAARFNDDRLERTLSELEADCAAIWLEVIQRALLKAGIKIDEVAHDLTAYITYGLHENSKLIDFGFAHNTPMKLRKFKCELNTNKEGGIPLLYKLWSGRTGDEATVEANMEQMSKLMSLCNHGKVDILLCGDRANLNDELAFAYKDHHLRYLAGLRVLRNVHKDVLLSIPEKQFYAEPNLLLQGEPGVKDYWGKLCCVPFEYQGRKIDQRGLIVISGPMRTAIRETRAQQFRELRQQLAELSAHIGSKRLNTPKTVQRRANQIVKASPVGKFISANVLVDEQGHLQLHWFIRRFELLMAMQWDGRYLLVTNDFSLSAQEMFALYHQKDVVEKCFHITKHDLKVSPIYLHKDERITTMMLVNMLALLTYRLIERQTRQHGLTLTTRQIIAKLERISLVKTVYIDGSCVYRCVPIDDEQKHILLVLAAVLDELPWITPGRIGLPSPKGLESVNAPLILALKRLD